MQSLLRCRLISLLCLVLICAPIYVLLSRYQLAVKEHRSVVERFQKSHIEQKRRKQVVDKTCRFLKINQTIESIPVDFLDHLIVDDVHRLIYCYVPKVASTNWKRVLLMLQNTEIKDILSIKANETHQPNVFKTLNQYPMTEIQQMLEKYQKFYFVRHPYERILSAYRNKLEDSYVDYFRTRFGTEIIKRFRTNPSKESLQKGHDVKFEEFIQYIITLNVNNWKIAFNEHWRPIFDICFPCHINYDYVGKYETLEDDAEYILNAARISKLVKFPDRQQTYKKQRTAEVMHKYYRNLTKDTHKKLFEIYKEDFTLFEYEAFY